MKALLELFSRLFRNRSDFFRDTVTIITGSAFSRVLAFLSIPILSRIFTPEEFGVLALFVLMSVTVACVASGRYEVAIVLPDDDSDALHLAFLALVISALTSIATFVAIGIWGEQIVEIFSLESNVESSLETLGVWLKAVPLYVFIISLSSVISFWATRKKLFGYISGSEVAGTGVKIVSQVGLQVTSGLGAGALILGQFGYHLTNAAVMIWGSIRNPRAVSWRDIKISRALQMLKRYKKFPQFEATANLMSVTSREFPVLILGLFFPLDIVGLYSISYRIMSMPSFVIGLSIMRVFYPLAKESKDQGNLDSISRSLYKQMLMLAMTPALLFLVAAPEVVEVVLGRKWINAGVYIQWLTIFMLSHFMMLPFLKLFLVYEKQQQRLIYQLLLSVFRLGALIIGGLMASPILSVALASIIGSVINFVTILILLFYTGVRLKDSLGIFIMEIAKSLPFALVLFLLKDYISDDVIVTLVFLSLVMLFIVMRYRSLMLIKSRMA
ncbi:MAG: oligosaccharide flippase family protein [Gammaproteobacteria bacterium]